MAKGNGAAARGSVVDDLAAADIPAVQPARRLQVAVLAREVHAARRRRMLSLEQLASLSGVSRSMISKVERGEAVPSTTVLAKLAEALGVTFAQLMSHPVEREVLVIEAARQPVITDPTSGLARRCLSPVLPGRGIDFLLNTLPPRGTAGLFGAHRRGVEEYVYLQRGTLEAAIGDKRHVLHTGDALYFQADANHSFTNIGEEECAYFLIIDSSRLHR